MRYMKLFLCVSFACMLFGCGTAVTVIKSSSFDKNKYKKVAVLYFDANASSDSDYNVKTTNETFAQTFVLHLMDSGFDVIERAGIEKILKEQNLSLTGAIDNDTLKQIGKIAGVDAIVMGNYNYMVKESKIVQKNAAGNAATDVKVYKSGDARITFNNIAIRFVDVETAKVVLAATYNYEINGNDLDSIFAKIATSLKEAINK